MGKSSPENKSFQIPKRLVWEAYQRVKANKGAAGVDGQSVEEFEKDLKGNPYKIWNRMSSGSYFPPPVRAVEIAKAHGRAPEFWACPPSPTGSLKQWWRYSWNLARSQSFMTTRTGTGRGVLR